VDSGEKLLAELDTGRLPDFIALGCDLADGAGIDLAHRLRERSEWTEIPLVMLCQGESPAEPEELQQLGIRRVLRKPLSPRTLQLELAALLGKDLRPQQRPRNTQHNYSQLAQLRVLVAEDNTVNRMVIRGLLGKLHIEPE